MDPRMARSWTPGWPPSWLQHGLSWLFSTPTCSLMLSRRVVIHVGPEFGQAHPPRRPDLAGDARLSGHVPPAVALRPVAGRAPGRARRSCAAPRRLSSTKTSAPAGSGGGGFHRRSEECFTGAPSWRRRRGGGRPAPLTPSRSESDFRQIRVGLTNRARVGLSIVRRPFPRSGSGAGDSRIPMWRSGRAPPSRPEEGRCRDTSGASAEGVAGAARGQLQGCQDTGWRWLRQPRPPLEAGDVSWQEPAILVRRRSDKVRLTGSQNSTPGPSSSAHASPSRAARTRAVIHHACAQPRGHSTPGVWRIGDAAAVQLGATGCKAW